MYICMYIHTHSYSKLEITQSSEDILDAGLHRELLPSRVVRLHQDVLTRRRVFLKGNVHYFKNNYEMKERGKIQRKGQTGLNRKVTLPINATSFLISFRSATLMQSVQRETMPRLTISFFIVLPSSLRSITNSRLIIIFITQSIFQPTYQSIYISYFQLKTKALEKLHTKS